MIILVANDNALTRELTRELLEGSGQVAEKFGFQQIFAPLIASESQKPEVMPSASKSAGADL